VEVVVGTEKGTADDGEGRSHGDLAADLSNGLGLTRLSRGVGGDGGGGGPEHFGVGEEGVLFGRVVGDELGQGVRHEGVAKDGEVEKAEGGGEGQGDGRFVVGVGE
jgi:hypothetical protein